MVAERHGPCVMNCEQSALQTMLRESHRHVGSELQAEAEE
jgi:hypothetical protein